MPFERVPASRASRCPGFTLIEVLFTIAILGLISGLTLPVAETFVASTFRLETEEEMNVVAKAIEAYFSDVGSFPGTLSSLETKPSGVSHWMGPYSKPRFVGDASANNDYQYDTWRHVYRYASVSPTSVRVRSIGPNGVDDSGGGDDIDRIVDVNPIIRDQTVLEMQRINLAIVAFNVNHLPDQPLSSTWVNAVMALQASAFLPTGNAAKQEYSYDAWNRLYVPGPAPVSLVTSAGPP